MKIFLKTALFSLFALSLGMPANAQPEVRPYDREHIATAKQIAFHLVMELEHLQEDISLDLRGQEARRLYYETDRLLAGAMQLRRSVEAGAGRRQLYRDFQVFDRQLHDLLIRLRDTRTGSVERAVARVQFADDQLHRAISVGDRTPGRQGEVISRQAHALDREAQFLTDVAKRVLVGPQDNQRLREAVHDFADKAAVFHQAVERTNDPQRLNQDFHELQRSRTRLINTLNTSGEVSAFLFQQAQRIAQTLDELERRVLSENERRELETPPLKFRYPTLDDRR